MISIGCHNFKFQFTCLINHFISNLTKKKLYQMSRRTVLNCQTIYLRYLQWSNSVLCNWLQSIKTLHKLYNIITYFSNNKTQINTIF